MVLENSIEMTGSKQLAVVTQEFTVTELRRRPATIWSYVDQLGCVAIITRRQKKEVAIMSIDTYVALAPDPAVAAKEIEEITSVCQEGSV